jgi:hypothetical protein
MGKDFKALRKHGSRVAKGNDFSFKLKENWQQSTHARRKSCYFHSVKEARQQCTLPLLALGKSRQQTAHFLLASGTKSCVLVPKHALYTLANNQ